MAIRKHAVECFYVTAIYPEKTITVLTFLKLQTSVIHLSLLVLHAVFLSFCQFKTHTTELLLVALLAMWTSDII